MKGKEKIITYKRELLTNDIRNDVAEHEAPYSNSTTFRSSCNAGENEGDEGRLDNGKRYRVED